MFYGFFRCFVRVFGKPFHGLFICVFGCDAFAVADFFDGHAGFCPAFDFDDIVHFIFSFLLFSRLRSLFLRPVGYCVRIR